MKQIRAGSTIGIPCDVSDGAFENELLVEFETLDGKISGFTSVENTKKIGEKSYIRAEVLSVERDHYLVRVEGSFFSTNGLANVTTEHTLLMAA